MGGNNPRDPREAYYERIAFLQRSELDVPCIRPEDVQRIRATPITSRFPLWLAEVHGISRFWTSGGSTEELESYLTKDILAGLNGQGTSIYFLVKGEPKRVSIYIGTLEDTGDKGATLSAAFNSSYPGLELWPEKRLADLSDAAKRNAVSLEWEKEKHETIRPFINSCQNMGVITGVPTPKIGDKSSAGTQIDRLIRGLYGTTWAFLVLADPVPDRDLVEMQLAILRDLMQLEQQEVFIDQRDVPGKSLAVYYSQLLDMQRQILDASLYEGGWWVQSYIGSPDPATYQRAKGLVKSIYSGDYSRLERIRVLDCPGASQIASGFTSIAVDRHASAVLGKLAGNVRSFKYHTLLSSGQLASLAHLPRIEMPGYFIRESATFDVSSHAPLDRQSIGIGEILDRGRSTGNFYRVPLEELTKHCLLVGITGSGKTTTSKNLFQKLSNLDIPILVIEPAKREYRRLASLLGGKELRVFTVGEEGSESAPFRLNPFEIREGVNVQTHVDLLRSVFNASFGMWSPLPQVLERAIYEIYQDKGWNTVESVNDRDKSGSQKPGGWNSLAQPTLTDLYHKVGDLVPRLGYDEEVERNIRTALETRINSLRIGAKGLMLDTRVSIPMAHLLSTATVLELEGLGDDDEKAFLMGLILVALYEHYRFTRQPAGKMHITVVEEAHRLLTNVPPGTDPEAGNLKGKAVETFVNMLSEVRAYGEGFIIAEQIPSKLAPDVIKNTGLKIMHRTVSSDDRQVMGGAMNLDEQQLRKVVALATGEAVVHGGGRDADDNAILIRVPNVAEGQAGNIRASWERFVKSDPTLLTKFHTYPSCRSNCPSAAARGSGNISLPDKSACVKARKIADDPVIQEAFAAFLVSLVVGSLSRGANFLPGWLKHLYSGLRQGFIGQITGESDPSDVTRCLITHLLYHYLEDRGARYGWQYVDGNRMVGNVIPALLAAAGQGMDHSTLPGLTSFCQEYPLKCELRYPPFWGCDTACFDQKPQCLFRYSIGRLLEDNVLDNQFTDVKPSDEDALVSVCEAAAERVLILPEKENRTPQEMGYFRSASMCFLIQKMNSLPANWPVKNRENALLRLAAYYDDSGAVDDVEADEDTEDTEDMEAGA